MAGRSFGTTSLVAASQLGHVEVVYRLLAARADPHQTLHNGTTARQLTERALAKLREEAAPSSVEDGGEGEPAVPSEQGGPASPAEMVDDALDAVTASLGELSPDPGISNVVSNVAATMDGLPLAARLQKVVHMLEAAERRPKE